VSGDVRSGTEGEAAVTEEEEAGRCQGDLFAIFKKVQGPLGKLRFPTATKVK
jgi:hypothetical protein